MKFYAEKVVENVLSKRSRKDNLACVSDAVGLDVKER